MFREPGARLSALPLNSRGPGNALNLCASVSPFVLPERACIKAQCP